MVEKRLKRRDQAGLPQPARASLLASASGARETHAARETTAAGASFFAFLSHITCSQHKRRISHQTSDRSRDTLAGDWRWRVYTNNVAATTTNCADPSDNWPSWHGRLAQSRSTRDGQSLFPSLEGTKRNRHTTSGVRTSTVAS